MQSNFSFQPFGTSICTGSVLCRGSGAFIWRQAVPWRLKSTILQLGWGEVVQILDCIRVWLQVLQILLGRVLGEVAQSLVVFLGQLPVQDVEDALQAPEPSCPSHTSHATIAKSFLIQVE